MALSTDQGLQAVKSQTQAAEASVSAAKSLRLPTDTPDNMKRAVTAEAGGLLEVSTDSPNVVVGVLAMNCEPSS